jgi:type II secretory pathway pseudopilin PulG
MMRSSFLRNEKGFTILEAVFAAGILAFAILSYTILKTSSRHSQVFSKQLSQAIQVVDSQMDDFAILGYNDPLLAPAAAATPHLYSELGDDPLRIDDFVLGNATWTVKEGCPGALSKLITFTGQWNMSADPAKAFTTTRVQVRK